MEDSKARRSWRPSRIFSRPAGAIDPAPLETSALTAWALSGWIGLACGLAEGLLQLAWRRIDHHFGDPDLWVNWHSPWLAPLSMAACCLGLGMVASLVRGIAPRATARLIPFGLIAIGTWSVLGVIPGTHPWAIGFFVAAFSVRISRLARYDSGGFRRFARASLPALAATWSLLFVTTGVVPVASEWWWTRSGPTPPAGAPNVLLVVLDTVRADNLSLHGYGRPTTPRLETWARRGVRFDQARSTSPYTLGTHASLFTGHWMSDTSARVNVPLDGQRVTLAEHLRGRGYATGGFVGNIFYGSAHYGLDRGFVRYHDIPGDITRRVTPREFLRSSEVGESLLTWVERRWRFLVPMQRLRLHADELNREALGWVDGVRQHGRPFFLFVNYFDAHSPYSLPGDAPQPYSRLTADRLEARMRRLERAEERHDKRPTPDSAATIAELAPQVNSDLRDSYDDGITWIDRKLDELLRALERRGLLENTLVVVTADHGEMLGEHGVIGHGKSLHRQVVHVPLVIIDPRGMDGHRGRVVAQPVSVRDVPATILDLLGDPDEGRFPGRSLARYWGRDGQDVTEADGPVLSEMEHLSWRRHTHRTPAASGPLWLLTEGRWSYHRQGHESGGTLEHLFDLVDDPGEERDLAPDPAHGATLEALRGRFEAARGSGARG